ncbi:hypothetical protein MTQ01_08300 [Streptomyces sp. XM4193]|uniref:hypothetical protein n=1 Tax=Streptomyces sp. XM4193 TaxID=2929782 RepID=UPI001FF892DB|nr:hypothetical protein [Streptomyces sp. XM4193]MCK1796005.1 hypothetical protein [Streptomyces sp. XM4193]
MSATPDPHESEPPPVGTAGATNADDTSEGNDFPSRNGSTGTGSTSGTGTAPHEATTHGRGASPHGSSTADRASTASTQPAGGPPAPDTSRAHPEDRTGSADPRHRDDPSENEPREEDPSEQDPSEDEDEDGPDDGADQLPCGRHLDALWETWADDPAALDDDPHVADCPHCSAALAELRLLDGFVREEIERDEQEAAQTSSAHAGTIADRVMDIVRTELRPGASVPLGAPDEDQWITETAAARTFREAAEREPGVEAGSCRIAPAAGGDRRFVRPGARLPRGPVRVRIGIIAPLRTAVPVPAIADSVRTRVATAADRELGMEVAAVDVVVVDLAVEPDAPDMYADSEEGSQ